MTTVTPYTAQYVLVLNSGLVKIANLIANNSSLPISKFEVGSDYGYEPTIEQVSTNSVQLTSEDSASTNNFFITTTIQSTSIVQIDFLLNNYIGNFNIGEIILKLSDGTPFLIAVLDIPFSKFKDPNGNAFQISFTVNLINTSPITINQAVSTFSNFNVVANETLLPSMTSNSPNVYVVQDFQNSGQFKIAYKNLNVGQWWYLDGNPNISINPQITSQGNDFNLNNQLVKTTSNLVNGKGQLPILEGSNLFNVVPIGSVLMWAGSKINVPVNFLYCNGAILNTIPYASLFNIIGYAFGGSGSNFNLPDMRGRFVRGVSDGSGNDPDASSRVASNAGGNTGDNVGTYQGDLLGRHNHTYPVAYYADDLGWTAGNGGYAQRTTATTNQTGGNETRPKNLNFYFIIRYQ